MKSLSLFLQFIMHPAIPETVTVQVFHFLKIYRFIKLFFGYSAGCLSHLLIRCIVYHPYKISSKKLYVTRLYQKAVITFDYCFIDASDIRSNYRQSAADSFKNRHRQTFKIGWQDKQIRIAEKFIFLL